MDGDRHRRIVDVKGVKGSTLPKGRALTPAEIEALFKACAADPSPAGARDAALLALGYAAGLRRAEIVGLDLADFNAKTCALVVRGKGNKERRVFVTNGACEALHAWLGIRGDVAGPLFLPVRKGGHVARGRLAPQTVYDVLAARVEQAGVERPSPHDLRRSCISDLLDRGNDLAVVQRLAGHASPVTTARYDRRPDDDARRAAGTLTVPFVAPGQAAAVDPPRPGRAYSNPERAERGQGGRVVTRMAITKGRSALAVAADRAAERHERIVLRRGRKDVAAVVPIEDLKLLEKLREEAEDREDVEEARRIEREERAAGRKPVPLEVVKRELGL